MDRKDINKPKRNTKKIAKPIQRVRPKTSEINEETLYALEYLLKHYKQVAETATELAVEYLPIIQRQAIAKILNTGEYSDKVREIEALLNQEREEIPERETKRILKKREQERRELEE